MIKIKNMSDKVELKESENDVIEIWNKKEIQCFPFVNINYDTGISIECEDDDMVFLNSSKENFDKSIYIVDNKFSKCQNNKSIKLEIYNYSCKFYTVPKDTKLAELTLVTRYYNDIKKYNNLLLNIGNIAVMSSLKDQSTKKFESFINSDGTEDLIITLKLPISK